VIGGDRRRRSRRRGERKRKTGEKLFDSHFLPRITASIDKQPSAATGAAQHKTASMRSIRFKREREPALSTGWCAISPTNERRRLRAENFSDLIDAVEIEFAVESGGLFLAHADRFEIGMQINKAGVVAMRFETDAAAIGFVGQRAAFDDRVAAGEILIVEKIETLAHDPAVRQERRPHETFGRLIHCKALGE